MAKEILTDCKVSLGGVDLADHVRGVTLNGDAETRETTGFGATFRTYAIGFKNWTVDIDFYDDFADNNVNENFYSYWGTSQPIAIVKSDTTTAATNPSYTGFVLFTSFPVLSAQVGEVAGGRLSLQGTGVLTRNVS